MKKYYAYLDYGDYPEPKYGEKGLYLEGCGWFHNYYGKDRYDGLWTFDGIVERKEHGMFICVIGTPHPDCMRDINIMLEKRGREDLAIKNTKIYKGLETMTKLNVMMKKLLDKDIQLLIKADYINGDLEPTAKGKAAIDALNFIDRKEELVLMAKEDLEEEEKTK